MNEGKATQPTKSLSSLTHNKVRHRSVNKTNAKRRKKTAIYHHRLPQGDLVFCGWRHNP